MDSDALATFLSVHRTGSVSAAARVLSRTQSAISRRLAVLEGQVGLPLFDRVGRALALSDAGRALLPHAERAVAALDDARAAAAQLRDGRQGLLRLVVVGTLADERLTGALRQLARRFPDVDVRLATATSSEVSQQVRAGEATLGLRYFEDRGGDVLSEHIAAERLVVACAPTHPLAGRRVAGLQRLAAERWLAFPVQDRHGELFARSVFAQFLARDVTDLDWVAVDSLTAQKRLVEAGLGIALLPSSAIRDERRRRTLSTIRVVGLAVEVPVASVRRAGAHHGEAARALLAALKAGRTPK